MLSERSYGRFQERSLWIFCEYCCGTFSQYSFWTFKNPGHFLSSRNVPMEPSEHSMGTFREGIVLWGAWWIITSDFLNFLTVYRISPNIAKKCVFWTFWLGNLKNLRWWSKTEVGFGFSNPRNIEAHYFFCFLDELFFGKVNENGKVLNFI